ncbi:MAG: glycoside hydrolase family 3 protein [Thermoleophilia bacterium]|nr:glycoside hydrolase family 3 protein [Thermoleophilia bacterium]
MSSRLQEGPFHLSAADADWVEATLARMSVEEKIGQVFCLVSYRADEGLSRHMADVLKVGGVMCRRGSVEDVVGTVKPLQEWSDVPMLVAANLESGGYGACTEGTRIGSPMAVAATDDVELAYRLGVASGREASALGLNWAFAPVADIDFNFRNPITNTRTFGADPTRVEAMTTAYLKGVQENGVAATPKHFPGDGVDERDQHLVTTVNSLNCEEWDASYDRVFKACIEAGALAMMVGHIALPEYSKKLRPGISDEDILPASLSYEIATILLREKLGFNGLVVSDATAMAGMAMAMERSRAVPQAIAAGCDVFLFTRNLGEDFRFMRDGLVSGILTEERLTDAVRNVLALKAALGLHRKQAEGGSVPSVCAAKQALARAEHQAWAEECADRSITLVKEEAGVLPLSPTKGARVLLYELESDGDHLDGSAGESSAARMKSMLEREGFTVETFVPPDGLEGAMPAWEEFTSRYDLMIYVAAFGAKSNQTTVRIDWAPPMGSNVPIYMSSVPTVFISLENPYHLLDVPRVRTYINTYGSSDVVLEALMDKLMGRSAFKGTSPVDPFCGKWDTRL